MTSISAQQKPIMNNVRDSSHIPSLKNEISIAVKTALELVHTNRN